MPRWPKKTLMEIISLLNSGSAGIIYCFVKVEFFTQDIFCKNDTASLTEMESCAVLKKWRTERPLN
jgi:hypothetical protein